MPCARELTYCSEDRNTQPECVSFIKGFKVSKARDTYPEHSFDDENRLCKFKDIYSIHQTFQMHAVIGKCEAVQVYIFM